MIDSRYFRIFSLFICVISMSALSACDDKDTTPAQVKAPPKSKPNFGSFLIPLPDATTIHGKILFIEQRGYPHYQIASYDFDTRIHAKVFGIPKNGWINQISNSPDGHKIALAYSSTETNQPTRLGHSSIYLIDINSKNTTPQALPGINNSAFSYDPVWSNDGRYLYFVSYQKSSNDNYDLKIMRYDFNNGEHRAILDNALWPRLSSDGTQLTYLTINPANQKRALWVTDAEGKNPRQLIAEDALFDLNLPLFSPDSQTVYFGVPENPIVAWYERLLPVSVAYAHGNHDVPSRWGTIATQGGDPELVDMRPAILYYGQFSKDGRYLAYTSDKGFSVWELETQKEKLLLKSRTMRVFTWL